MRPLAAPALPLAVPLKQRMTTDPFDTAFLRKLELLELVYRRLRGGRGAGESIGTERGGRMEFREHRRYAAGDDFRYIDWNVFGRSDSLFVKEYAREERRSVTVLLDASRSMQFGRPSKLACGKQLAASFAYLALVAGDEAVVTTFSDDLHRSISVAGRKGRITEVLAELRDVRPGGRTSIHGSLKTLYGRMPRRSLVVLISDLMDADCKAGLATLPARGFEPCVIHLLSREEAAPAQTGRLHLEDCETGDSHSLWIDGAELQEYEHVLNEFVDGWKVFCSAQGIAFVTALSDVPFDELMLGYLRRGGVVQ